MAHRPGGAIGHPDRVELARGEQPRHGAGIQAVCPRPRGAHPGVVWRDDDHLGDVGLDDALDLPGVAGDRAPTRSSEPRLRAKSLSCSGVASIRPAERTSPTSAIATSQNSRWTSNPSALTCSYSVRTTGEAVGKTTSTHARSERTRTSRRGGHRKARALSPSSKNRPANLAPSRKPLFRSADRRVRTGSQLWGDFHLPKHLGDNPREPAADPERPPDRSRRRVGWLGARFRGWFEPTRPLRGTR
jgi:hypothetical protein